MNEKILIIDRETDIQEAIEVILKKEGYQTQCASSSKKAIAILKTEPMDLVIMDIRLSDGDGLKLIKKIKKLNWDIGIVVLTGSVCIDHAVRLLRDGEAFDFLSKPLENEKKLINSVERALAKSRLIKEKKKSAKQLEQAYREMESRYRELHNKFNKTKGDPKSRNNGK